MIAIGSAREQEDGKQQVKYRKDGDNDKDTMRVLRRSKKPSLVEDEFERLSVVKPTCKIQIPEIITAVRLYEDTVAKDFRVSAGR